MKKLSVALLTAIAITSTACMTVPPSKQELQQADYGEVTASQAEALIRDRLGRTLIDPYSYHLNVLNPPYQKNWAVDKQGRYHYGRLVGYGVNAKNAYGGYVGTTPYIAFIEKGQIIQVYEFNNGGTETWPHINEMF